MKWSAALSTAHPPLLWVNDRRCEWGHVLNADIQSPCLASLPPPPPAFVQGHPPVLTAESVLESQSWKESSLRITVQPPQHK